MSHANSALGPHLIRRCAALLHDHSSSVLDFILISSSGFVHVSYNRDIHLLSTSSSWTFYFWLQGAQGATSAPARLEEQPETQVCTQPHPPIINKLYWYLCLLTAMFCAKREHTICLLPVKVLQVWMQSSSTLTSARCCAGLHELGGHAHG